MGDKKCEAGLKHTGKPCRSSPMAGSRYCNSHQDPDSRYNASSARGVAALPSLEQRTADGDPATAPPGSSLLAAARAAHAHAAQPAEISAEISASDVQLRRNADGVWRCADRAASIAFHYDTEVMRRQAVTRYRDAARGALIGGAIAEALNNKVVQPDAVHALSAHISGLLAGRPSSETANGCTPIAVEAAAMHVLNRISADATHRWDEAADGGAAARSQLLHPSFYDNDPLRSDAPDLYTDTCVEQATHSIAAGAHVVMDYYPIERIVFEAMTMSPVTAAERTGLGSVVGGGPGFFSEMHQAHKDAGTGAHPNGMIVLSQAHRCQPGSDEFSGWVRDNLLSSPHEKPASTPVEARVSAICGVIDVAVQRDPDADLAVAALAAVAEIAPDDFDRGVKGFCSFDDETDAEILAAFRADKHLRNRVAASVAAARQQRASTAREAPRR